MSYRIAPARAVVRADVCLLNARLSYSLLALACAWPLSAMAQSSTRDPVDLDRMQIHAHRGAATEGTDSYTADVARSSTKLQLSLRETPQSVVVVTRQQIVDRNLQSLQDVTDTVAGFNSPTWDTERTYINARGFEVDYYRIDGIPTDYSGDVQQNMAIYDRVEIIRGANGLTSGAGSPAASIDLVRKHADSDVFTGRVDLSAGRWDRYRGTVDLQSPLNTAGNVRGRVVTSYEDKQSFRDYYSKQSSLFYGIVDADFSDATSGYIGVNKQRNDGRGTTWGGVPAYFSDGSRTDFARSDSFTPRWARGVADTTNAFAGLTHRFDNGAQLHVEYSHQRFEADWKSVLFGYLNYPDRDTGLGLASNFGGRYPTLSAQNSLDAYATVPLTLWGREHELVAGATWMNRNLRSWSNAPLQPLSAESVYAWTGRMAQPEWTPLTKGEEREVRQVAAYAAGRFSLTDALKAIVGARITDWKNTDQLVPANSYERRGRSTPYAGLIFDVDDHHSLYASYTGIFKPQSNRDRSGRYIEPLEGNSYEVGAKGEYLGGQLNAALALFRIEQDNRAVNDPGQLVPGTTDQAYLAAKGTVSQGVEFQLDGQLSEQWRIAFGFAQFDANDASGVDVNPTSPRREATLFTSWQTGPLRVGGGLSWQSAIHELMSGPQGNTQRLTQGSVLLANAMARYDINQAWSAQLNVRNLFDRKYYANIVYQSQLIYGDPRDVELTVSWKF
ncbi:TonB-dependent siderophore receptor [Xanthomonas hortorum pv. vitians]|uniref:FhuE receptor n=1 Tax=Xanthomonas hortorum pv. vitians TaxID=83224 RepID=A0A6V7FCE2_9XANT|nr:TonB-dependent siderophore receptor [Xanthomonas hortorum]APP86045.1 ligand-gated channel [Xanthomonas hortorum pv. gardneri]ASW47945.1 ligand-gated channel [Xanthomonas hortorum]MCC8496473.1 TonB-dependent siderophore receptor [Xanthomonas hortorum pv. gardneri]MCE4283167.1 TonB-dependent siderophore receptor [Xanthomonas hortorum pv. vitians]MCE4284174.1 TonB-dependent siderophore receptor [Xanthomonas hortorum pv. vitians]